MGFEEDIGKGDLENGNGGGGGAYDKGNGERGGKTGLTAMGVRDGGVGG